ncbi:MAG TPA: hypothetical protein VKT82_33620 [Ktedonobacterales bacterium]|nr:hypothetical protein [Ktedonobacterales bacterium]
MYVSLVRSSQARRIWGLLGGVALLIFLAGCGNSPTSTTAPTATMPPSPTPSFMPTPNTAPFQVTFRDTLAPVACPAGQPAGTLCLAFKGQGQAPSLGTTSLARTAIVSATPGSDGCQPISSTGTLTAADGGKVNFTAAGEYCASNDTATYTYTITGGTGKYQGASGTGTIRFPPSSGNTGVETWSGTLLYPGMAP